MLSILFHKILVLLHNNEWQHIFFKKLFHFPQNPAHTRVLLFPGHVCFQSSAGHPLTWKKVWRRRWPFPEATSAWSLGAPGSLPGQTGHELLVPNALLFSVTAARPFFSDLLWCHLLPTTPTHPCPTHLPSPFAPSPASTAQVKSWTLPGPAPNLL